MASQQHFCDHGSIPRGFTQTTNTHNYSHFAPSQPRYQASDNAQYIHLLDPRMTD
jgi:hypothetical protein